MRYVTALGGLAFALALCGSSIAQNALTGAGEANQQQSRQDEAQPAQPKPPSPTTPVAEKKDVTGAQERIAEASEELSRKPSFMRDPIGWIGAWILDPDNFSDFLMVLFTLALTVVAFKQHFLEKQLAETTKASLAVAKQSADAALATQRPWIAIDLASGGPLVFGRNTLPPHEWFVQVGMLVKIRNVGPAPANQIWIQHVGWIDVAPGSFEAMMAEMDQTLATAAKVSNEWHNRSLFPAETHEWTVRLDAASGLPKRPGTFRLYGLVRVKYRHAGGEGWTVVHFALAKRGSKTPTDMQLRNDITLPEEFDVVRMPFGHHAN